MHGVIFTLYNRKTGKFEEKYYEATRVVEAMHNLWDDYDENVYVIDDWYTV